MKNEENSIPCTFNIPEKIKKSSEEYRKVTVPGEEWTTERVAQLRVKTQTMLKILLLSQEQRRAISVRMNWLCCENKQLRNLGDLQGWPISFVHIPIVGQQWALLLGCCCAYSGNKAATIWNITGSHAKGEEKMEKRAVTLKASTCRWHIQFLCTFHWPKQVTCSPDFMSSCREGCWVLVNNITV